MPIPASFPDDKRVLSWPEAQRALLRLRRKAPTMHVVFTNGVFDLLHAGHIRYLRKARAMGDLLIVGMNTDASVRRLKGPTRPLQAERDRALILSSLRCVDAVVLFGDDTPLKLITLLRPEILVKGADYKLRDIVGYDQVRSWGGKVRRISFVAGRSTTALERRLQPR